MAKMWALFTTINSSAKSSNKNAKKCDNCTICFTIVSIHSA